MAAQKVIWVLLLCSCVLQFKALSQSILPLIASGNIEAVRQHIASSEVSWAQEKDEVGQNFSPLSLAEDAQQNGATALHVAAKNGHGGVLELIIEKAAGLDLNATDVRGNTPLHLACQEKVDLNSPKIDCNWPHSGTWMHQCTHRCRVECR